ncbi:hypothetical protein ACFCP7_02490 [Paenibacillus elgii]
MIDPTLRNFVLGSVAPVVQYGLKEMTYTSVEHAMYEVAAIAYLMGRGCDWPAAHSLVESWEVDETLPPFQGHGAWDGHYPHLI